MVQVRYISTFFAFLSLIGFGLCTPISVSNENYLKQTEWVIRKNKVARKKVLYFTDYLNLTFLKHNTHSWFKEYVRLYDQIIIVKILSQIRSGNVNIFYDKLIKRLCFPRMSIDGYDNFCMNSKTTESTRCNHLLTSRWINIKRNINSKEKEDLDGCRTGFL